MKKLYFIRHGLSEANVQGIFSGRIETPLTKGGREQAKTAGQSAKNLDIDYIVSSPQERAKDTAKIIAKEIGYPLKDIHFNRLFVERDLGELEGKPWSPDINVDGFSDIETVDDILERAKLAIRWLHSLESHNILVVSHGSFGRALRHHLLEDQPFHHQTNRLNNAEIVQWL